MSFFNLSLLIILSLRTLSGVFVVVVSELQLKEERRQLFEEANKLSLLSKPEIYKDNKTTYRVWDHTISGCWDGYGKNVRVIVSEEITTKRIHSKEGKGWQEKSQVSNWMWVTNLLDSKYG